jgi:uncharacterized protein YoxC
VILMDTKFTVGQIVLTLSIILGAAVLGYLILILSRIAVTVRNINNILETNKDNIDNTMNSLPGIVANVNEITGSVRKKTDMLDGLFSEKEEGEGPSLIGNLETAISAVTSAVEIFNEVKGFFGNKKRRIFKIKR